MLAESTNQRLTLAPGILKNSQSYQHISPDSHDDPSSSSATADPSTGSTDGSTANGTRPAMATREMSEKDIVQHNTELNAGGRRSGSGPRGSDSRRQSSTGQAESAEAHNMRLKWDEANLYLNEGQMGGKMKIDEPKTPYAKQYDPVEDEDEVAAINANEVAVDELEMDRKPAKRTKESDIPGLDLGEPEMDPLDTNGKEIDSEKSVKVDSDAMDVDGRRHGEEDEEHMGPEELEKHRKFEEMRKKHYEMKNIKNLLG